MRHIRSGRFAVVAAFGYAALAALWIVLSDWTLSGIADYPLFIDLSIAKGLAFVAVTATLLYVTMRFSQATAERHFSATFEQAAVGIAHLGGDGRWLRVNARFCEILGYGRDELLRTPLRAIVHPDDLPSDVATALSHNGSETFKAQARCLRKDGSPVWVSFTSSRARDAKGRPDYHIVVIEDISARVAAEEALRERVNLQDYLSKIVVALPGVICSYVWPPSGRPGYMPYASSNLEDICGVKPEEVRKSALAFLRRIHPDDIGPLVATIEQTARTLSPAYAEHRYLHPAKGEIWLEGRFAPERMADGGTLAHGFIYDITDRKRNELRLRQAAAVFTSTHEGVVITDPTGSIIAVNPAFGTITGYGEHELLGKSMRLLRSGRHDRQFYEQLWRTLSTAGFWQGEIWNRRKNGEVYPEWLTISTVRNEKGDVVNYVGTFTDITRIKQSEARLEHLAHHDPLTDLPNRLVLHTQLERAVARAQHSGSHGAVLFLDLDRFKDVNDSLGHPVGDELLMLVARRLKARLRAADLLARLGGDEFVVLLEKVATPAEAGALAEALIAEFSKPFALASGREVYVGASVGISLFPEHGRTAEQLIQHADAALFQAKDHGRGIYHIYTPRLTRAADARLALEARLRRAIERNEFLLHYQPLVRLADLQVTGLEALVRWQHPELGLLAPMEFLPAAEEAGLMLPIGEWVMRAACRQMKRLLAQGLRLETMAVNLSPRHFQQADIHERVRAILADTGLPACRLELEITESALMKQRDGAVEKLSALKALGVRIAIDDFGTGYSSLAYLKRFPIDKLKIDQGFVSEIPGDHASKQITSAIIALGKTLHLELVAEGVETQAQFEFLKRLGCDTAQGYLFSRPLPENDVAAFVRMFSSTPLTFRRPAASGGRHRAG